MHEPDHGRPRRDAADAGSFRAVSVATAAERRRDGGARSIAFAGARKPAHARVARAASERRPRSAVRTVEAQAIKTAASRAHGAWGATLRQTNNAWRTP